ncbi:MAG TPA: hypothetical protein VFH68_02540 [Polyangia bacterium]|nr:hypothetical protein [Polyangia bacterium]
MIVDVHVHGNATVGVVETGDHVHGCVQVHVHATISGPAPSTSTSTSTSTSIVSDPGYLPAM